MGVLSHVSHLTSFLDVDQYVHHELPRCPYSRSGTNRCDFMGQVLNEQDRWGNRP